MSFQISSPPISCRVLPTNSSSINIGELKNKLYNEQNFMKVVAQYEKLIHRYTPSESIEEAFNILSSFRFTDEEIRSLINAIKADIEDNLIQDRFSPETYYHFQKFFINYFLSISDNSALELLEKMDVEMAKTEDLFIQSFSRFFNQNCFKIAKDIINKIRAGSYHETAINEYIKALLLAHKNNKVSVTFVKEQKDFIDMLTGPEREDLVTEWENVCSEELDGNLIFESSE